jgi:acyl-coenzyme A thioesterase PaaI-like protein
MDMDQLALLKKTWDTMRKVPGGKRAFGRLVGRMAPYTGTIDPLVREVRTGYSRVEMRDRKGVRNHLKSIHAIALMNLAEASSGLAFTYSLPVGTRAILTGLSIDYMKKARGTLTAESFCPVPETNERSEYEVTVVTRDEDGDVVTKAVARWLIAPL